MTKLNLLLSLMVFFLFSVRAEEKKIFIIELQQQPLAVNYGSHIKKMMRQSDLASLKQEHQQVLEALSLNQKSASNSPIIHEYFYAFNGFAMAMSQSEVLKMQKQIGIKSISQERTYHLNTDIGPQWIGADRVWEGLAPDTPANKGEGVVIGIIDTGINPSHPSFSAHPEDNYSFNNPMGHTFGLCTAQTCNDKLIGIYDFTNEGTNGIDSVGHGSHVSGIAAGNVYSTEYLGLNFTVSGVAPHANIISYKACTFSEEASGGTCSGSALLSAIDQATIDGVDVVNYSIGSETPCSPWAGLDGKGSFCANFGAGQQARAMLNARNAGVVFVVSTGNSGPGPSTVGYPAIAPWVVAVANTTHSRQLQSSVINFTGGATTLENLIGASATGGIGPLKIVHAKDFGNALCGQGNPELKSQCSGSGNDVLTGASNPFAPGTFNGEIVVCDRGSYGRVEKGFNVKQAGAAGYILANTVGEQESIVADNHCLPAVHLGNEAGTKLRTWLDSGSDHMGTLTGQNLVYFDGLGDVMNSSSSRGPTEIVYNSQTSAADIRRPQNYMKPNISAPGTSIFSATKEGEGLATLTGTSMASPHVAGAAALIKAAHPSYSPAQIISSLILTSDSSKMLKEDKATKAEFVDQGAGRTQVDQAIANSLYFDVSRQDFINANPQIGGDVSALNLPELINDNCYPSCSFIRKVKMLSSFNVVDPVWDVSTEQSNGLDITVTPSSFDFSNSNEITLNITINTTANDVLGDWAEAKILFTLHSSTNSNPLLDSLSPSVSKLPVAVFVPSGNYPAIVEKQTSSRHGRFNIDLTGISAMTDATYQGLGIFIPEVSSYVLNTDANNTPFDTDGVFESTGTGFSVFEVDAEKIALIAESNSTGNNPADLYIGKDLNINGTPDENEILCQQIGNQSNKRCVLREVKPGKYWLMVHNKSSNGTANVSTELTQFAATDTAQKANLDSSIVFKQGTGLYVQAPVQVQTATQLNVTYKLPVEKSASNHYYGVVAVGADQNSVGKTAVIPVKITVQNPQDNKLYSLNNEVFEANFTDGDKFSNLYVDTGKGADKITLRSFISFSVKVYQTDFSFNPLSIKPNLSNLTPVFSVESTISGIIGDPPPPGFINHQFVELNVSGFEPSRWYIEVTPHVAFEPILAPLDYFSMDAFVIYDVAQLVSPTQSLWYNPSRSGWGIDLTRATTTQAVTWYRYNEDGTQPTWLQAVGALTQQNQWQGDMNHVTWNGSTPRVQDFGEISMVYTSESTGIITISEPDKTYSEPLFALNTTGQNCAQFEGMALDVSGLWFLPSQSGFGNSILATENNETTVLYFYDALGLPTWVIGTRDLNTETTLMNQTSNGFCPDCVFSAINQTQVGTIMNTYSDDSTGTTTADVQLLSPLNGHWLSSGNSSKLNNNFGCIVQ